MTDFGVESFSATSIAQAAFKKLFGLAHTEEKGFPLGNEGLSSQLSIIGSDIYAESISATAGASTNVHACTNSTDGQTDSYLSVVQDLTIAPDGSGEGHPYIVKVPASHGLIGKANPLTGGTYALGDRVQTIIPKKYGITWRPVLYDALKTEIPPLSASDWFLDERGIVVIRDNTTPPAYLSCYVYTGPTVQTLISSDSPATTMTANARVAVSKNSGATIGTRRKINLIEGSNVTLTVTDDAGNEEVDVTIAASGGGGTVTSVSIGVPAEGLTQSGSPITGSGTITLGLANDLAALEGLTGTGLAVRSGASTWVQRNITGTSAEITVTNGDGVASNPNISLPTALTFTGKTITGGTYSSPTLTTPSMTGGVSGGVIYFSAATTMASSAALAANQLVLGGGAGAAPATLGGLGTTNQVLHGNATGSPTWASVSLGSDVSGDLPFANLAQGSARSVLGVTGNATADMASIQGTANQTLLVNSAGTALTFSNPEFADSVFRVFGGSDKKLAFEVDGFTASTTRTLTPQNADYTIAGLETANTFTTTQTIYPSSSVDALIVKGSGFGNTVTFYDAALVKTFSVTPEGITNIRGTYNASDPAIYLWQGEVDASANYVQLNLFAVTAPQQAYFPDATGTFVYDTAAQTLTNKTLTVNSATSGCSFADSVTSTKKLRFILSSAFAGNNTFDVRSSAATKWVFGDMGASETTQYVVTDVSVVSIDDEALFYEDSIVVL